MKIIITLLTFCITLNVSAQVNPVDFEPAGNGADWTWTVFENDTNPDLEIITNPFPSGINTSATVAQFTALATGQPFAGCETMHGADVGTFTLTADNAYVAIMVYKDVISDVGIKFATFSGASTGEIKIPNTLTNQWERLVFDFSGIIGEPSSTDIDQLIVFPDFQARSTDNVILFDNIIFGDISLLSAPDFTASRVKMVPNPAQDVTQISSLQLIKQVHVYNMLGQELISIQPNSNELTLNTAGLKSGVYLVRVTGEQGGTTLQLVKN